MPFEKKSTQKTIGKIRETTTHFTKTGKNKDIEEDELKTLFEEVIRFVRRPTAKHCRGGMQKGERAFQILKPLPAHPSRLGALTDVLTVGTASEIRKGLVSLRHSTATKNSVYGFFVETA